MIGSTTSEDDPRDHIRDLSLENCGFSYLVWVKRTEEMHISKQTSRKRDCLKPENESFDAE